ncbi:MAG: hypothetical protein HYZ00_00170 [Candidatus Hydrogenedentes bacterium]|nr:hypothetical protein [Candidatus Hydrogenedentota bacterium]
MKYTCLLFACCVGSVAAQQTPTVWVPPPKDTTALEAEKNPLPVAVLRDYLKMDFPHHAYRALEGKNEALQQEADNSVVFEIGRGYEVGADAVNLFEAGFQDGEDFVFLAAITSVGAYGIRLQVDLAGLALGEEAWFIDPTVPRAFGPYTTADQEAAALWLPSVEGDTAVIMLRSRQSTLPPLRLERISHFFRPVLEKAFPCPIHVNCETDPDIRAASTAVGRLLITIPPATTILCSGSLVEAPDTPEQEPFLISANHCFRSIVSAGDLDVFWDYRAADCDGTGQPSLGELPRSEGESILVNDARLDFTFLRLKSVPNGTEGRAYLGWSVEQAEVNDEVLTMHHPQGTVMKISYGVVTDADVATIYGQLQNEINWLEGITEGGSSGGPGLYTDSLTLMGVLSNGTVHTCGEPQQNFDNYSSFADFFPEVACYLSADTECEPPLPKISCPAKATFGPDSASVAALRNFRDKVLAHHAWGRAAIADYYARAPQMAAAVAQSEQARAVFGVLAFPFIVWGAGLG